MTVLHHLNLTKWYVYALIDSVVRWLIQSLDPTTSIGANDTTDSGIHCWISAYSTFIGCCIYCKMCLGSKSSLCVYASSFPLSFCTSSLPLLLFFPCRTFQIYDHCRLKAIVLDQYMMMYWQWHGFSLSLLSSQWHWSKLVFSIIVFHWVY